MDGLSLPKIVDWAGIFVPCTQLILVAKILITTTLLTKTCWISKTKKIFRPLHLKVAFSWAKNDIHLKNIDEFEQNGSQRINQLRFLVKLSASAF